MAGKPARILREQDAVTGGGPGAEDGRGCNRAESQGQRALATRRVLGEPVERAVDRLAQLLERQPAIRAWLQAAIERVAELARQVGTEPSQRPHAGADRP